MWDNYFAEQKSSSGRRILLMPAMPTPNGRIHLGHVAGPFMRMDILNRHFRTRGVESLLSTGVDAYESHVLLRAQRDGVTPLETCNRYAQLIEEDLKAVLIDCDRFINPVSPQWSEEFKWWNNVALERLRNGGAIRAQIEKIPRGVDSGRVIAGCWISGECPICGGSASGYCCSSCGYHFRPEELIRPRARVQEEPLEWVTVRCLYLEIEDVEKILKARPGYPKANKKVLNYLERQRNLVRLSAPGEWGVPIQVEEAGELLQVVFTYTAIGFQLMVGDSFRALHGSGRNGFDPDAEIEVVGGFGSDNVIPFIVGMQGSLVAAGYRPFDHFLINEMMHLEGELFTTSGGHAIWAGGLINSSGMHPDGLRSYLAKVSPEESVTNLTIDGLLEEVNLLADRWGKVQRLSEAVSGVVTVPEAPGELLARLGKALRRQDETLDLERGVRIRPLPAIIDEWLGAAPAQNDIGRAYWWLKGLALLAYPLMPGWAQEQWAALGHEGIPRCAVFCEARRPTKSVEVQYLRVRRSDLERSLPDKLKGNGLRG